LILEVIGFNIESCDIIEKCGAQRIELCDNPGEGGTTPSYGMIKEARKKVGIDLFPIIRPRGGDFLYNENEFEIMKEDILICKRLGCDGVVLGMLTKEAIIDKRCMKLVEMAYPMETTFHRAFDRVMEYEQSLEDIISMGFTRLLTSGLKPAALDGAATIAALIKQADNRITIMPGSGIRSGKTGAIEFHTSARKTIKRKMVYPGNFKEGLEIITVDEDEIKKIMELSLNKM